MKELPKQQFISQGEDEHTQLRHIQSVLDNGCQWIQVRFKKASKAQLLALAEKARRYCEQYQALCFINDHVDVALSVDADGVHLGLTDMPVSEARKILGEGKIIGGTANTLDDVRQRISEACDYVGLGPYRFTTTKEKLSPILGLEGYRDIVTALRLEGLHIPIYAIGGIREEDIQPLYETGIYGVAASGLFLKQITKSVQTQYFSSLPNNQRHVKDSR
ncbi:thiamine phosphate synthase [Olivibacter sitiensis]|uniref:thiamine phosphate synthase n=1 Tax=Olivibacter sitiensis TaxID=376470 RepID=UPI0004170033|nr:thiamine phosphate synthase [Olivibacter sitiensis]